MANKRIKKSARDLQGPFMMYLGADLLRRFNLAMTKQRYGMSKTGVCRELVERWVKEQGC